MISGNDQSHNGINISHYWAPLHTKGIKEEHLGKRAKIGEYNVKADGSIRYMYIYRCLFRTASHESDSTLMAMDQIRAPISIIWLRSIDRSRQVFASIG